MGITNGQRNMCLELVQKMAYALSEENYLELYSQFKQSAPSTVLEYFDEQWHSIRKQWTNNTNNRLESLNSKLKSVISRYSTLEEFVDKFFLIRRVLRSERDHVAGLTAQKVPVKFHSTTDPASISYMKHLTPYAYKFVAKQLSLAAKVKLQSDDHNEHFHASTSACTLKVSTTSCECIDWHSMRLPCRHIFAVRKACDLDLFDDKTCDKRWSMEYYMSSQRVFLSNEDINHEVPVVNFAEPSRKILSQVLYYYSTCNKKI